MDRRDFIKYSTASLAGLSLIDFISLGDVLAAGKGGKYSVVILGDTHFDAMDPEVYHAGYSLPLNPKREANHRKEFVRNGKMWQENCPRLVKRAGRLVDKDTRYIFQTGDLIHGDTADADTHKRFLDDAMSRLKTDLASGLPLVTVAGNHDLRGNDDAVCARAYSDYMVPRMSSELGQEISSTNFLFRCGPDVFIVVNFSDPDIPAIERMLGEASGARHIFMLIHSPVFPFDSAKYWWWFLLGDRQDSRAAERRHIRSLLARNNVIVLCGHVHTTEFMDWYGDGGRITQMTMSSVWSKASMGEYSESENRPEQYGTLLFDKDPKLLNGIAPALFDEYRPGLKAYSRSVAVGSYKLIVDGRHVYVDFYAGDSPRLSKRFTLR